MRRALVLVPFSLVACAGAPHSPCHGPSCPVGQECSVERCVEAGSDPVERRTTRVVLVPSAMALVTEHRREAFVPAVVRFGHARSGDLRWFLSFDTTGVEPAFIDKAFLLLDPASTAGLNDDVTVSAWTVREAWSSGDLTWKTRPELGRPSSIGLARSAPNAMLRIDVTEIAKHLTSSAHSSLALAAEADEGLGAAYFTGASGGQPPRLEMYVTKGATGR